MLAMPVEHKGYDLQLHFAPVTLCLAKPGCMYKIDRPKLNSQKPWLFYVLCAVSIMRWSNYARQAITLFNFIFANLERTCTVGNVGKRRFK